MNEPSWKQPSINASVGAKSVKSTRRRLNSVSVTQSKLVSLLQTTQQSLIRGKNDDEIEKKSKEKVILGIVLMLLSGVLYSGLASLVKWGSDLGYNAAEILVYRASVQMCVAGTSYYLQARKLKKKNNLSISPRKLNMKKLFTKKQIAAIIGRGLFGAASTMTYFEGTTLVPVGDCVTLKALAAVITSFAGYFILNDPLTRKHLIA
eukprot:39900_1